MVVCECLFSVRSSIRVPAGFGKVWNLNEVFSRSGKVWKKKAEYGKVLLFPDF